MEKSVTGMNALVSYLLTFEKSLGAICSELITAERGFIRSRKRKQAVEEEQNNDMSIWIGFPRNLPMYSHFVSQFAAAGKESLHTGIQLMLRLLPQLSETYKTLKELKEGEEFPSIQKTSIYGFDAFIENVNSFHPQSKSFDILYMVTNILVVDVISALLEGYEKPRNSILNYEENQKKLDEDTVILLRELSFHNFHVQEPMFLLPKLWNHFSNVLIDSMSRLIGIISRYYFKSIVDRWIEEISQKRLSPADTELLFKYIQYLNVSSVNHLILIESIEKILNVCQKKKKPSTIKNIQNKVLENIVSQISFMESNRDLWESVGNIYRYVEKSAKQKVSKSSALITMMTLITRSPSFFFDEIFNIFMERRIYRHLSVDTKSEHCARCINIYLRGPITSTLIPEHEFSISKSTMFSPYLGPDIAFSASNVKYSVEHRPTASKAITTIIDTVFPALNLSKTGINYTIAMNEFSDMVVLLSLHDPKIATQHLFPLLVVKSSNKYNKTFVYMAARAWNILNAPLIRDSIQSIHREMINDMWKKVLPQIISEYEISEFDSNKSLVFSEFLGYAPDGFIDIYENSEDLRTVRDTFTLKRIIEVFSFEARAEEEAIRRFTINSSRDKIAKWVMLAQTDKQYKEKGIFLIENLNTNPSISLTQFSSGNTKSLDEMLLAEIYKLIPHISGFEMSTDHLLHPNQSIATCVSYSIQRLIIKDPSQLNFFLQKILEQLQTISNPEAVYTLFCQLHGLCQINVDLLSISKVANISNDTINLANSTCLVFLTIPIPKLREIILKFAHILNKVTSTKVYTIKTELLYSIIDSNSKQISEDVLNTFISDIRHGDKVEITSEYSFISVKEIIADPNNRIWQLFLSAIGRQFVKYVSVDTLQLTTEICFRMMENVYIDEPDPSWFMNLHCLLFSIIGKKEKSDESSIRSEAWFSNISSKLKIFLQNKGFWKISLDQKKKNLYDFSLITMFSPHNDAIPILSTSLLEYMKSLNQKELYKILARSMEFVRILSFRISEQSLLIISTIIELVNINLDYLISLDLASKPFYRSFKSSVLCERSQSLIQHITNLCITIYSTLALCINKSVYTPDLRPILLPSNIQWSHEQRYNTFNFLMTFSGHGPYSKVFKDNQNLLLTKLVSIQSDSSRRRNSVITSTVQNSYKKLEWSFNMLKISSHRALEAINALGPLFNSPSEMDNETQEWLISSEKMGFKLLKWILAFHIKQLLPIYIDYGFGAQKENSDIFISAICDQFIISRNKNKGISIIDPDFNETILQNAGGLLLLGLTHLGNSDINVRQSCFNMLSRLIPTNMGLNDTNQQILSSILLLRKFVSSNPSILKRYALELSSCAASACSSFTENLLHTAFNQMSLAVRTGITVSHSDWIFSMLNPWSKNIYFQFINDTELGGILIDGKPGSMSSTEFLQLLIDVTGSEINKMGFFPEYLRSLWTELAMAHDSESHNNFIAVLRFLLTSCIGSQNTISRRIIACLFHSNPELTLQPLIYVLSLDEFLNRHKIIVSSKSIQSMNEKKEVILDSQTVSNHEIEVVFSTLTDLSIEEITYLIPYLHIIIHSSLVYIGVLSLIRDTNTKNESFYGDIQNVGVQQLSVEEIHNQKHLRNMHKFRMIIYELLNAIFISLLSMFEVKNMDTLLITEIISILHHASEPGNSLSWERGERGVYELIKVILESLKKIVPEIDNLWGLESLKWGILCPCLNVNTISLKIYESISFPHDIGTIKNIIEHTLRLSYLIDLRRTEKLRFHKKSMININSKIATAKVSSSKYASDIVKYHLSRKFRTDRQKSSIIDTHHNNILRSIRTLLCQTLAVMTKLCEKVETKNIIPMFWVGIAFLHEQTDFASVVYRWAFNLIQVSLPLIQSLKIEFKPNFQGLRPLLMHALTIQDIRDEAILLMGDINSELADITNISDIREIIIGILYLEKYEKTIEAIDSLNFEEAVEELFEVDFYEHIEEVGNMLLSLIQSSDTWLQRIVLRIVAKLLSEKKSKVLMESWSDLIKMCVESSDPILSAKVIRRVLRLSVIRRDRMTVNNSVPGLTLKKRSPELLSCSSDIIKLTLEEMDCEQIPLWEQEKSNIISSFVKTDETELIIISDVEINISEATETSNTSESSESELLSDTTENFEDSKSDIDVILNQYSQSKTSKTPESNRKYKKHKIYTNSMSNKSVQRKFMQYLANTNDEHLLSSVWFFQALELYLSTEDESEARTVGSAIIERFIDSDSVEHLPITVEIERNVRARFLRVEIHPGKDVFSPVEPLVRERIEESFKTFIEQ